MIFVDNRFEWKITFPQIHILQKLRCNVHIESQARPAQFPGSGELGSSKILDMKKIALTILKEGK